MQNVKFKILMTAAVWGVCSLVTGVAWGEEVLQTVQVEGQPYVALTGVARATGGTVEWLAGSQKVRLRVEDGQIVVTPDVSLVTVGRSSVRLPDPPRWVHGAVHVPVKWFLPLVEPFAPSRIKISQSSRVQSPESNPTTQDSKISPESGVQSQKPKPTTLDPGPVTHDSGEGRAVEGREAWKIHTVIIDPGHGGKDQGAVGPTGLEEKEVALKVALHLQALIEQRLHIRVILTRSSDAFVSLGRRARVALENDGRMFISLHCNAVTRQQRETGGTEVYFLSEARTEEAREVARRENGALAFEENGAGGTNGNSILRDIFEGMSSDQYLKESQDLAAEIRGAVARTGGVLKDRGVKQAGFYVMKGTQARMPSVLVEMAFISSPREERMLRTESFQKQLSGAIFEGVRAFKAKAEQAVANK